jgi:hypothetical protein
MHAGNMPACPTNMVALPYASSSPTDPLRAELESASILLAVVGMLPTTGFDPWAQSAHAKQTGEKRGGSNHTGVNALTLVIRVMSF